MTEEFVERIADDLYFIRQPFHGVFTGVTVVLGKSSVGLVDSGLETTPADYVFPLLRELGRKPEDIACVVNTHRDGDHVLGNKVIKEKTGARIAVHELDAAAVETADLRLKDGETVELGDGSFRVVHTPGHTSGSICLYDARNRTLISGDSIQGRGVEEGKLLIRTSHAEYIESMRKLLKIEIAILIVDHPYRPYAKGVLTGDEPKAMILASVEAAERDRPR